METSYKEKYEQAIERLKQWDREHPCAGFVLSDRDKFIFPELAESEDEKIRKALKQYFVNSFKNNGVAAICGVHVKDVLAWLERQAERKTPQWMIDFLDNYRRKIGCSLDHDEARDVEGKILCIMQWLENQCEQEKDILEDAILDGYIIDDDKDGLIAETIRYKKEKHGDQNSTNKVEPKFKVGEKELTNEELREGLIRGMVNEHNRVTKEILRNEYEKGRADVLAKIDAIDVDEMVYESGATSRVTQYWYAHGVNDVIKKLKEE